MQNRAAEKRAPLKQRVGISQGEFPWGPPANKRFRPILVQNSRIGNHFLLPTFLQLLSRLRLSRRERSLPESRQLLPAAMFRYKLHEEGHETGPWHLSTCGRGGGGGEGEDEGKTDVIISPRRPDPPCNPVALFLACSRFFLLEFHPCSCEKIFNVASAILANPSMGLIIYKVMS